MDFPFRLALRYMGSKKRAAISVSTALAVTGVALGALVLALALTVTGGFRSEFREKVLGVNAHVLVLKYSSDFREYRDVMKQMHEVPGVIGVAPFVINPMMITHEKKTATGILLKGIDPKLFSTVLDLPRHIVEGSTEGLRVEGAKPPERASRWGKGRKKKKRESPLLVPPAPSGKFDFDKELKKRVLGGSSASVDAGAPEPRDAGASESSDAGEEEIELTDSGVSIVPDGGYAPLPDDEDGSEDVLGPILGDDACDPDADLPGIIMGITLKEALGVELGECVTVTSPTVGYTYSRGGFSSPVAKKFRLIAVFSAGFDQYDSKLVYTDLYEAQRFSKSGDSVTGVEMKVDDIDGANEIKALVDQKLGNNIYHTMDWEELNHGLFTALRVQQIMVSLALGLIILVAAFTPMATLIMVVMDKKADIAVMKAMGATSWQIVRSFLYQGAIIGVLGAVFGLGLGWALCTYLEAHPFPLDPKVYFISHLPVQVRGMEFVLTGLFAVAVCIAAAVWPAVYAARLRPAEAFREQ